jgi:sulfite reductase (NADPH) hemoprotein beta-component
VTADQYAGVAEEEIEDPRIWSEIIRQWSTFHPEFSFLPRKFKIAVTGCTHDRAAVLVHDIGIAIVKNAKGDTGFRIYVGGGQGRTPMIAPMIRDFLPKSQLIAYLDAIMRVYNELGRRDNIYKARIKILVHQVGTETFREMVEDEFSRIENKEDLRLPAEEVERIAAYFAPPAYKALPAFAAEFEEKKSADKAFATWVSTNVAAHKVPGYAIANISLKPIGGIPGDASAEQMEAIAEIADRFSFGEIRVTHEQNLTLADVEKNSLYDLWRALKAYDLVTPNIGLISDIIACPGLDYCDLANARSIPLAQQISRSFESSDRASEIGELKIKISGCINACGHHHVGNIGILGVDKKGTEFYQITLGGSADENAALGDIVGPAFTEDKVIPAIDTIVQTYLEIREGQEKFLDTYRRVGLKPFKEKLYATH